MKKRFITLLPLLTLLLAGCGTTKPSESSDTEFPPVSDSEVPSTPSDDTSSSEVPSEVPSEDSETPSEPDREVTVYFNLTKYGMLDGVHGSVIAEAALEYGVAYTALSGSTLPDETRVTHDFGAPFLGFFIQNSQGGGLQKITTMPGVDNLILEAQFDEGGSTPSETSETSETSSEGGGGSEVTLEDGVYLQNTDGTFSPEYKLTEGYSTVLDNTEYMMLGASFEAGFTFYIGSPNDVSGLGANTYPTHLSNKADGIGYTLSQDEAKPNYTADYLEVTGTPTESGTSTDGTWIKYVKPAEPDPLRFKESGVYNIYITFWDDYGWIRIYVEPAV